MRWMLFATLVMGCSLVALLLGVGLGVLANPNLTASDVIAFWSMLGSWVAGLGTLTAVAYAYWQFREQVRREDELLEIDQTLDGFHWTIDISSVNKAPARVRAVKVFQGKQLIGSLEGGSTPVRDSSAVKRLEQGDFYQIPVDLIEIAKMSKSSITELNEGGVARIRIKVETASRDYWRDVIPDVVRLFLDKSAAEANVARFESLVNLKKVLFDRFGQ